MTSYPSDSIYTSTISPTNKNQDLPTTTSPPEDIERNMSPSNPFVAAKHALEKAHLIPDVIPTSFASHWQPTILFTIVYSRRNSIHFGADVPQSEVLDEPSIKFDQLSEEEEDKFRDKKEADLLPVAGRNHGGVGGVGGGEEEDRRYTLVLTDPDAPSRSEPKNREWRHWIVQGLKPNGLGNEFKKTKEAITMYYPPSPPEGSGPHRYTFLLFQEPNGGYTIPPHAPEHDDIPSKRGHWNAMHFAEQNRLKLVGVTYFTVEVTK
ncbi:PEBP-like protein [Pluteus cervinus]|uniref:PEBP-like protein n=1 Tax=Pluteus cervinus TaxID=181527 RepID=A0ACD3AL95_9AGAR|nr:PEBP-like protein [Pluteus cervinus]